jgi:hypothetical protein
MDNNTINILKKTKIKDINEYIGLLNNITLTLKNKRAAGTTIFETLEINHKNPQNKWTIKVKPILDAKNQPIPKSILTGIRKKINCLIYVIICIILIFKMF